MNNLKKTKQLGMPYGTACNKLKKIILFSLIKKNSLNNCYRCNKIIVNICDLSIDHKIHWLDNDTKLFWNLDNIAFSHLKCNSLSRRKLNGAYKRIIKRKNSSWCSKCKIFKSLNNFYSDITRWNKKSRWCKNCNKIYRRELRTQG